MAIDHPGLSSILQEQLTFFGDPDTSFREDRRLASLRVRDTLMMSSYDPDTPLLVARLPSQFPGSILSEGEVDYYYFTLDSRSKIRVYTTGSTDTEGELGSIVDGDSDDFIQSDRAISPFNHNFRIVRTLEPGTYYVKVGAHGNETGSYTLHIQ